MIVPCAAIDHIVAASAVDHVVARQHRLQARDVGERRAGPFRHQLLDLGLRQHVVEAVSAQMPNSAIAPS